jgi:hypothetical protein
MMIQLKLIFIIISLTLAHTIYSQNRISAGIFGTIKDSETGEPVENANVYIANSLYGASTDNEGYYKIDNLPAGVYMLMVSHVNYYLEEEEIIIDDNNTLNYDFILLQKVYELPQLSVEAEQDEEWMDMFEIFHENLIGLSQNSEQTKILNPYVINFEYETEDRLIATSDVPIQIENKALGYNITYFLNTFRYENKNTLYSGTPVFEKMEPEDSVQKQEWEENRLRAYCGSFRHFLTAISNKRKTAGIFDRVRVISDEVSEVLWYNDPDDIEGQYYKYSDTLYLVKHGFNVIYLSELNYKPSDSPFMTQVNTNRFLFRGRNETEYIFQFPGFLQIVYDKEREEQQYLEFQGKYTRLPEKQVSAIALSAPSASIDHKGRSFSQFAIKTFGYWSFKRLADWLPNEYEVPDSVLISYDEY